MQHLVRIFILLMFSLPGFYLYAENEKPNIVIIFADDLAWNGASCYGNPHVETPNIDRLANEGDRKSTRLNSSHYS